MPSPANKSRREDGEDAQRAAGGGAARPVLDGGGDGGARVDFVKELLDRNMDLVVVDILQHLDFVTLRRCLWVSKPWRCAVGDNRDTLKFRDKEAKQAIHCRFRQPLFAACSDEWATKLADKSSYDWKQLVDHQDLLPPNRIDPDHFTFLSKDDAPICSTAFTDKDGRRLLFMLYTKMRLLLDLETRMPVWLRTNMDVWSHDKEEEDLLTNPYRAFVLEGSQCVGYQHNGAFTLYSLKDGSCLDSQLSKGYFNVMVATSFLWNLLRTDDDCVTCFHCSFGPNGGVTTWDYEKSYIDPQDVGLNVYCDFRVTHTGQREFVTVYSKSKLDVKSLWPMAKGFTVWDLNRLDEMASPTRFQICRPLCRKVVRNGWLVRRVGKFRGVWILWICNNYDARGKYYLLSLDRSLDALEEIGHSFGHSFVLDADGPKFNDVFEDEE